MKSIKLFVHKQFYSKLLIACILCSSIQILAAQEPLDSISVANDSTPVRYRINKAYLKSYWTEFKGVATAPAHWGRKDWTTFAVVTGSAGVMMLVGDKPVQEFLQRNRYEAINSASKVFYPLGNRLPPALITGMYIAGVVTKNRKLEHLSLSVAKSLALSTAFYVATKATIRRMRPDRTDNPRKFAAPFTQETYTGFPSGHSNTAFAVATAFAMEYKDKKWVSWVAYSLASLTALDRMYQNRHWTSDVIIGASIGHFVTKKVYQLQNKRRSLPTGF